MQVLMASEQAILAAKQTSTAGADPQAVVCRISQGEPEDPLSMLASRLLVRPAWTAPLQCLQSHLQPVQHHAGM